MSIPRLAALSCACLLAFAAALPAGDAAPGKTAKILEYLQPVPDADKFMGEVAKYSVNGITIHTYASKEAYQEWSILFETDKDLVLLEPQPMPASSKDFRRYMDTLGKPLAAVIAAYHGVGPESFPGTPIYASPAAIKFIRDGRMEIAMNKFARIFPGYDVKIIVPTRPLSGDSMTIAGVEFLFSYEDDAWPMPAVDVGLPAHKMVYLHALGGDTHSAVNSREEIAALKAYLEKLKGAGYEIFLTSHHMPETVADVDAKIAYLDLLKKAADEAKTEPEFIAEMLRLAPGLKGEAYLGITASKLYPKTEVAAPAAAAQPAK